MGKLPNFATLSHSILSGFLPLSLLTLTLCIVGLSCGEKGRFGSPNETYETYRKAVELRDASLEWKCYTKSYRKVMLEDSRSEDYKDWSKKVKERSDSYIQDVLKKRVVEEKMLDENNAYLILELGGRTEFLYFTKEKETWRMTSFLDEEFRKAIERAVRRGKLDILKGERTTR